MINDVWLMTDEWWLYHDWRGSDAADVIAADAAADDYTYAWQVDADAKRELTFYPDKKSWKRRD